MEDANTMPAIDISNGVAEDDECLLDEDKDEHEDNELDTVQDEYHVDQDPLFMQNMGKLDIFIDIFAHQDLLQDETIVILMMLNFVGLF